MEELNKRDLHKNFAVLLRYIVDDGFGFLEEYILHRRTKGDDDAPMRRCRRKIFKALCSLLLFFRLGMRIINYSFQKRRQNKPCFSLKAEAALAKHIHPSFAAVIVPMRFSKKENFFGSFQTKKSRLSNDCKSRAQTLDIMTFFTCSAEAKKSFVEPQVECCKRDNNSAMKNGFALQLLVERRKKTWITKGSSYCYFFVFLHKVRWRLVDRKIKQQLGNFSGNKLKKELWENYRDYFACYTSKVGHQKQQHIQLSRCCLLLSILVQVFFPITLSGLFNDNISTQWYVIRNVICLLNELL